MSERAVGTTAARTWPEGGRVSERSGAARARVVLATRNSGKITELRRILADAAVPVEIVGLEEFPQIGDVPETGLTFAENALLKAHAVARESGLPAIADDSGLCVDALNGMPGIFSARWSGTHGDDKANLDLLLAQVSDVPEGIAGRTSRARRRWPCPRGGAGGRGRAPRRDHRRPARHRRLRLRPDLRPGGRDPDDRRDDARRERRRQPPGRAFRALVPILAEALG
nr:hypothetical protein GCM10020093_098390 [Planobispora longispora]